MTGRLAPRRRASTRTRVAILAGLLVIAGVAFATVAHGMAGPSPGAHGASATSVASEHAALGHDAVVASPLAPPAEDAAGCAGCLSAPHDVAVACALLVAAILLALSGRARRHLWQTADAPATFPPPLALASRPHRPDLLSLGVSRS